MTEYKILKDFKGSPDGRFTIQYHVGEVVPLTPSLAEVALAEKWVKEHKPRGRKPKQTEE